MFIINGIYAYGYPLHQIDEDLKHIKGLHHPHDGILA